MYGSLELPRGREPRVLKTIVGKSPRRVRSPPIPIKIPFDYVENESDLGPIDLDEDIMGSSEPFFVPKISELVRPIDDDIYTLVGKSW